MMLSATILFMGCSRTRATQEVWRDFVPEYAPTTDEEHKYPIHGDTVLNMKSSAKQRDEAIKKAREAAKKLDLAKANRDYAKKVSDKCVKAYEKYYKKVMDGLPKPIIKKRTYSDGTYEIQHTQRPGCYIEDKGRHSACVTNEKFQKFKNSKATIKLIIHEKGKDHCKYLNASVSEIWQAGHKNAQRNQKIQRFNGNKYKKGFPVEYENMDAYRRFTHTWTTDGKQMHYFDPRAIKKRLEYIGAQQGSYVDTDYEAANNFKEVTVGILKFKYQPPLKSKPVTVEQLFYAHLDRHEYLSKEKEWYFYFPDFEQSMYLARLSGIPGKVERVKKMLQRNYAMWSAESDEGAKCTSSGSSEESCDYGLLCGGIMDQVERSYAEIHELSCSDETVESRIKGSMGIVQTCMMQAKKERYEGHSLPAHIGRLHEILGELEARKQKLRMTPEERAEVEDSS